MLNTLYKKRKLCRFTIRNEEEDEEQDDSSASDLCRTANDKISPNYVSWQAHESTSGRRLARPKVRRVRRIPENPVNAHFGMRDLAARKTLAAQGSVGAAANSYIAALRIVNTVPVCYRLNELNSSQRIEIQPHRSSTQNR